MKKNLRAEAEKLANRPYRFVVSQDETTDGKSAYAALVVELNDCIGHGNTEQQAIADASSAAIDYIESLLEEELPVPMPLQMMAISFSSGSTVQSKRHQPEGRSNVPETAKPPYILAPT